MAQSLNFCYYLLSIVKRYLTYTHRSVVHKIRFIFYFDCSIYLPGRRNKTDRWVQNVNASRLQLPNK